MNKIAIVILNWNTKDQLEQFLPNLLRYSQGADTEIIIVDNGSTDGSVEFLKKNYPEVRKIVFDKNYGYTGGYNKALEQVEAKYYVLLNSDIEVTENWLEPLRKTMDSSPEIAACTPKIKSYHNKDYFEYAGAAGGFIDKFGYPFCRGRILDTIEKDEGQYDTGSKIFWATGACLFVRSDLFHKAHGLDDDFFAHMEEIDLCWRLQNMGYTIYYVPESTVYHVGGGTLPNNTPFKLFLNYRNNLFLLYKNLPDKHLVPTLTIRISLDIVSALVYLLKGNVNFLKAVCSAHIAFFRKLKILKQKRRTITTKKRELPDTIYKNSIVFDYYIKKKQQFSLLKTK
ncbi:MAG: glycosyltransferase family 2 protein [Bacteroidales bacterium]